MAKRDINLYYLQCEQSYLEMLNNVKELEIERRKGNVTQEEVDAIKKDTDRIRENYERLSYVMMLLNKPRNPDNKTADMYRQWYNCLQGASKEAVLDENADALANLKQRLKEVKENKKKGDK